MISAYTGTQFWVPAKVQTAGGEGKGHRTPAQQEGWAIRCSPCILMGLVFREAAHPIPPQTWVLSATHTGLPIEPSQRGKGERNTSVLAQLFYLFNKAKGGIHQELYFLWTSATDKQKTNPDSLYSLSKTCSFSELIYSVCLFFLSYGDIIINIG